MRNFRKREVLEELAFNSGETFMLSRGGKVKNYTRGPDGRVETRPENKHKNIEEQSANLLNVFFSQTY